MPADAANSSPEAKHSPSPADIQTKMLGRRPPSKYRETTACERLLTVSISHPANRSLSLANVPIRGVPECAIDNPNAAPLDRTPNGTSGAMASRYRSPNGCRGCTSRYRLVRAVRHRVSRGIFMEDMAWEAARLIPVSGINGPDEQERRGVSALLAVLESVREFGRAILGPLGAPGGRISAFIEVPFDLGDKKVRPDGVIRVVYGKKTWTALVEVKTGRNDLQTAQLESYLDVARENGFDLVLTVSNQIVTAPGEHPTPVDKKRLKKVEIRHLSWSQIHTEAVIERVNRSVSDPDQAWILSELIRYLEHPRSGAVDFDDMGPSWVAVRDGATNGTLRSGDRAASEVAGRYGQLVAFAGMRLSRRLGVEVRPALTRAELQDAPRRVQDAAANLIQHGRLHGALRVPNAIAPIDVEVDLRAGRVACSVTVLAPNQGKAVTRVNWLMRQLGQAPPTLLVEAIPAFARSGPCHTLADVRSKAQVLVEDPKKDIKTFVIRMSAPAGTKRGQGRGTFVGSVLDLTDRFYTEIVQGLKPWTPPAPTVKPALSSRDETASDEAIAGALPVRPTRLEHNAAENPDGFERVTATSTERVLAPVPLALEAAETPSPTNE
jgi:hypothetical protein